TPATNPAAALAHEPAGCGGPPDSWIRRRARLGTDADAGPDLAHGARIRFRDAPIPIRREPALRLDAADAGAHARADAHAQHATVGRSRTTARATGAAGDARPRPDAGWRTRHGNHGQSDAEPGWHRQSDPARPTGPGRPRTLADRAGHAGGNAPRAV